MAGADISGQLVCRRWQRHHFQVPVQVIVQTAHRTQVIGRATELNEGGIGVDAHVELSVGDRVEVEFSPSYAGIPTRLNAIVRNRSRYYYGLEFLAQNAVERDRLAMVGQLLRATADYGKA